MNDPRRWTLIGMLALLAAWSALSCGGDGDGDADLDIDSDIDSDSDVDVDSDADVDSDTDVDADVDGDGDADGDRDADADTAWDADAEAEGGCVSSGGTVTTASCCDFGGDLPNTCVGALLTSCAVFCFALCPGVGDINTCTMGECDCAPTGSRLVSFCECPEHTCFDGRSCVPVSGSG